MSYISIASDDRVFVLTGAGISAESGLPTFRAADGLWAGHSVEDVCTPEAWQRNPALVWEFTRRGARRGLRHSRILRTLHWQSWKHSSARGFFFAHRMWTICMSRPGPCGWWICTAS